MCIRDRVYGGGANLKQSAKGGLTLVILGFGVLEKPEEIKAGAGKVVEVPYVEPAWNITLCEEQQRESASVNLAAAKKIVSIGLGVAGKDDIPMVKELCLLYTSTFLMIFLLSGCCYFL